MTGSRHGARRSPWWSLSLALLLAGSSASAQVRAGQVVGVVRTELGLGIPGVTVVLDSADLTKRAVTDSLGRFAIAGVDSGAHLIRAVRIGFSPFERLLDVPARGAWIEIEMPRLTQLDTIPIRAARSGVFGKVIARERFSPLNDASVTVVGARAEARTSSTGDFNLPNVEPGPWVVHVQRAGFASRMLSMVVPSEGAVELAVVLDESRGGDEAKRMSMLLTEFGSRVKMRSNRSAVVARQELSGRYGLSLGKALRFSPSFLLTGLVIDDSTTCVFVNGQPKPRAIADEFSAAEVTAVEVYGLRGDPTSTLMDRWPKGGNCGLGDFDAPQSSSKLGLQSAGMRSGRLPMDNVVRALVIWTVR
ncbi:MAG TPA: carboxypeptidase-like regulatory domain-containing protein [Gemmatimonadaceae bacterium]